MLTGGVDPKYYLRLLLRRKWLILLVFAVVVGATTLYTTRQPRVYGAQISLIIDAKEPRFLDNQIQDVNNDTGSYYWANKEYLETQYKIIQSRAVSQRVVEKLNGIFAYAINSSSNISLFAGQRRGGLRCVSGVCRVYPPVEGVRLDVTVRF